MTPKMAPHITSSNFKYMVSFYSTVQSLKPFPTIFKYILSFKNSLSLGTIELTWNDISAVYYTPGYKF